MERLSICYVAFSYYPGQGATALFEYSRNLAKMGHNVNVIAAGKLNETMYEVVGKVVVQRIPVKNTKKFSSENIKFSSLARRTLKKIIKGDLPDIVHIFSYAGSSLIKLGNNNINSVKWIYDIRSGPIRGFPWGFLGKVVQKFESTLFDAVFVIDKALAEYGSGTEIFISPIGVDLQMFRPINSRWVLSRYGVKERDIVLVYSGSLSPQRKIENLIYAFWKASKEVKNLRLVLLGAHENLNYLKLLTEKLVISDKVLFLGYIDYQQMPKFLSAADIAVSYIPLVSAFDKQPPQKTIEYLACSLPVIATETVGNKRFIVHERNGLLTKDDPNSLSETIIRLSQDMHLREALSQRARPSVEDYDWKTIVNRRILHAYQKILNT
jgi:glycosyltransferase involved in cell wall biosynthesis